MAGHRSESLARLHTAVTLLFTNSFDSAEEIFLSETGFKGTNQDLEYAPMAAHLYSVVQCIRAISTYDDKDLDVALQRVSKAKDLCAKFKTLQGDVFSGHCHLLLAAVHTVQQNFLKVAWHIRKSGQILTKCEEGLGQATKGVQSEELAAAVDYGLGFFELCVSMLPPGIMKLAGWLGMRGTKESAISRLTKAQASNSIVSPSAAVLLLMYYTALSGHADVYPFGKDVDQASAHCRRLLAWGRERYSRGIFFLWMEARFLRQTAQLPQSLELSQLASTMCTDIPELSVMNNYQQGWVTFLGMRFAESTGYFQLLLDSNSVGVKPGQAYYSYLISTCTNMTMLQIDSDSLNFDIFSQVERWAKKSKFIMDTYARRKAQQFKKGLGRPVLDAMELILLENGFTSMPADVVSRFHLLLDEEKSRHASMELGIGRKQKKKLQSGEWNSGDLARYHLFKSHLHIASATCAADDMVDAAIVECSKSLSFELTLSKEKDKRAKEDATMAYAHRLMGHLCLLKDQFDLAHDHIDRCGKYKGFVFEKRVKVWLHSLRNAIAKEEACSHSQSTERRRSSV